MKCESCGASMKLMDGRDYFVCEYCARMSFPEAATASLDRVNVLGARSELACPLCDDDLVSGSLEGRRMLHCERCRGVLVANDDFAAIVKSRRGKRTDSPDKPRAIDPADMKRRLRCPSCGNTMDAHPYYGPGNVVVDSCGRCFLVWLDHGEITMIERAPGPV